MITDLLFLLALAGALVAAVLCGRSRMGRAVAAHDPWRCRECVRFLHPANRAARLALAALPRQTRGGDR